MHWASTVAVTVSYAAHVGRYGLLIASSPFPLRLTFIPLGYILVVRFSATRLRAHSPRYSHHLVIHVE